MYSLIAVTTFTLWELDVIGVFTMLGIINILLSISVITLLFSVIEASTNKKRKILTLG